MHGTMGLSPLISLSPVYSATIAGQPKKGEFDSSAGRESRTPRRESKRLLPFPSGAHGDTEDQWSAEPGQGSHYTLHHLYIRKLARNLPSTTGKKQKFFLKTDPRFRRHLFTHGDYFPWKHGKCTLIRNLSLCVEDSDFLSVCIS